MELGRIASIDDRDNLHIMRPRTAQVMPSYKYHVPGAVLDQGSIPACVGYAWIGLRIGSPLRLPYHDPVNVYQMAQHIDEWPGNDYPGTSVRAGAKIMKELNFISEYNWAFTLQPIIEWVLLHGPVVVGTNWYSSMFNPDEEHFVKINGNTVGGHAYIMNGVNLTRGIARFYNSWGKGWGRNGHFYMSLTDVERLILEDGEACTAQEIA